MASPAEWRDKCNEAGIDIEASTTLTSSDVEGSRTCDQSDGC